MAQEQFAPETLPDNLGDLVEQITRELQETEWAPRAQIERIVEHLGPHFAQEMLAETWRVEARGGLMVLDGSRRRTPGGVFFHLTRQRLLDDHRMEDLNLLFPVKSKPRPQPSARMKSIKAPPVLPSKTRPRKRTATSNDAESSATIMPPRLRMSDLPRLWMALSDDSEAQYVSVRELVLTWYGIAATDSDYAAVEQVLNQEQPYFTSEGAEAGMVRVRTAEELSAEGINVLHASRAVQPGALLLLGAQNDKLRVALCNDVNTEGVHVYLPLDAGNRTRYDRASVREVLGMWPEHPATDAQTIRQALTDILSASRRWQWQHPLHSVVNMLEAGQAYRMDDLALMHNVATDDLVGRLGLATMLNANPGIFVRQETLSRLHQEACYTLHPSWQSALKEQVNTTRPDQTWIQSVIDRHLGNAPDLYRRSINPDTGEVTLAFHFPDVARNRYADAINAAMDEVGVPIHISARPRQDALMAAAHEALPDTLTVLKTSLYQEQCIVRMRCQGMADEVAIRQANARFHEQTGWKLDVLIETGASASG